MLSIVHDRSARDELRTLGVVGGTERINPAFMSP
jgi:hypothetical protein